MFSNKELFKVKKEVKLLINLPDLMEKKLGLIRSENGEKEHLPGVIP